MRKFAIAASLLLATTAIIAEQPTVIETHQVKVVLSDSGDGTDVFQLEGDELEIGESREFTTKTGKVVEIIRLDDESFDIKIDGESLGDGDGTHIFSTSERRFETIQLGDDDEEHKVIFVGAGGGSVGAKVKKMMVINTDGETKSFAVGGHENGAYEHLQASGALDDLDYEAREKIEEALKSFHQISITDLVGAIQIEAEAH